MGTAEIGEVVESFAVAAKMCRDAGLDGVELHAGHGYLIQQFLSPLTNRRDDEYGGSLQNRMRFALEVFRAVRLAVGTDFPVGARLSTSTAPGNISAAELGQLARMLQDEGLISFLDISHGDYYQMDRMTGTMAEAAGYELEPNAPLLASVSVPRMVTGRFRTLEEAEGVLREGHADIVSLVRAQIADPDLVLKTREGRADQVRPCIACNQGCVGGLLQTGRMGCVVNPAAGVESLLDERAMTRSGAPKKVLIVGGGPAGMEAARVAALRGHRVILAEAGPRLGGAILAARRAPRMQAIGDFTDWLGARGPAPRGRSPNGQLCRAGGCSRRASGRAARGDRRDIEGQWPAGGSPRHATGGLRVAARDGAADLLLHGKGDHAGRSAVVLDDIGHYEAVAAAEFLVDRGASVTYVTGSGSFAPKMNGSFRNDVALQYLYRGRFRLLVGHQLTRITPEDCEVRPLQGERSESVRADLVVLVTNKRPARELCDALRGRVATVEAIGDAASPRTLQDAVRDGHLAARRI